MDTYENDVVALKLLTSWAPSGPWTEGQMLRRLDDPHILPIRNADHIAGRPFLATESDGRSPNSGVVRVDRVGHER